ncbi:MAG: 50S ribosomal protein L16 [Clostridia bacterium]
MLSPKRTKYRKVQKGKIKGKASRGIKVVNGDYGIQALEPAWITANQIESVRVTLSKYTKKVGKTWIKIFPDKPITKKPAETRMGSGKGNPEYFVAVVKPGRILFEITGLSEAISKEALRKAIHKLPIRCKIVSKAEQLAEEESAKIQEGGVQANEI